jgi:murein DD-endopeptidase MepM/ murein hydrolase activator NlpD
MRLVTFLVSLCLALIPFGASALAARPDEDTVIAAGPNCTERVMLPALGNVIDAQWSPDSTTLAVTWFARLPSRRTVTGYQEDEITDALDVKTGALRPLGVGDHPRWSGSGAYLSYWGPNADELRVATKSGGVVARLEPTIPEVRWAGDTLIFIRKNEIRAWDRGEVRTLATLAYQPRYPSDDIYFSADGERATLTTYSLDGALERYLVETRTGKTTSLAPGDADYVEWAPTGDTLLLRYPDRIELRDLTRGTSTERAIAEGAIHGWSPDGRALLIGHVSPTVPAGDAYDAFSAVTPAAPSAYRLPNVLGPRAFSPDGKYFAGVSRTSLQDTQLEIYRCLASTTPHPDPLARERMAAIAAMDRRFVRPAAGDISQFLQGGHTGIDVAAPFGSLVVAADDGTVTWTGWFPNGRNRVCVQHVGGLESCYYHTSALLTSSGQRVRRGQPIALIGMTGITTGPHVHWEAKLFGRLVDPLQR